MTLPVSHEGGSKASVGNSHSGRMRWGRHVRVWLVAKVPTDRPVLPCSPAVLLVRGAWPPAAAPTSEEPPERPPRETPHAASPQLHELHETHSVAQVSGHVPLGPGQGLLGSVLGSHPSDPRSPWKCPSGGVLGWRPLSSCGDVTFSKIQLFKSLCVNTVSPPSKQRLKALVLPSLTALFLLGRAISSSGSRLLVES